MEKKYELTEETKEVRINDGYEKITCLHRIVALKDFGDVKKGDLGGWIEKEENLSHRGNCWVYDDARVYEKAYVFNDAKVMNYADVHGFALIHGNAKIYDSSTVYGNTKISDKAKIYDNASVGGHVLISGKAKIYGSTNIVQRQLTISGGMQISSDMNYLVIGPIGSRNGFTIFSKMNEKPHIYVCCGCFAGDINEFEAKVNMTHAANPIFRLDYLVAIEFAKVKLNMDPIERCGVCKPNL